MKNLITLLLFLITIKSIAQVEQQGAVGTKVLYFDNSGLLGMSDEQLTPLTDSSVGGYSGSLKYIQAFEGIFYQVFYGNKYVYFRKSTDGVTWSSGQIVSDTLLSGSNAADPNIFVWRVGSNINVGVTYVDYGLPNPQLKFVLSNDGGDTFMESIPLSFHADNDYLNNCGVGGKGDTLLVTWTRRAGDFFNHTWFSQSTDGGFTWSLMGMAYSSNQFSFIGDAEVDEDGNFYVLIADDQFFRVNLVLRKSTDLGVTWSTGTSQVTNQPSSHTNTNMQLRWFDGTLYTTFTHSETFLDQVNISKSTNNGDSWSLPVMIADTNQLHVSAVGGGTQLSAHTAFAISEVGTIYAVWADSRERNDSNVDSCQFNVYISQSIDDGDTWSANVKVNGPSNYARVTNIYASVAVKSDGINDTVLVSWTKLRDVNNTNTSLQKENVFENTILYPNPTSGEITIAKSLILDNALFTLYNMQGQKVWQQKNNFSGTDVILDLSKQENGVYFLEISNNKNIARKKIIKQ